MDVFVVFGDEKPFPGMPGSAVDRKILGVFDTIEATRYFVQKTEKQKHFEYVDFEVFELQ